MASLANRDPIDQALDLCRFHRIAAYGLCPNRQILIGEPSDFQSEGPGFESQRAHHIKLLTGKGFMVFSWLQPRGPFSFG